MAGTSLNTRDPTCRSISPPPEASNRRDDSVTGWVAFRRRIARWNASSYSSSSVGSPDELGASRNPSSNDLPSPSSAPNTQSKNLFIVPAGANSKMAARQCPPCGRPLTGRHQSSSFDTRYSILDTRYSIRNAKEHEGTLVNRTGGPTVAKHQGGVSKISKAKLTTPITRTLPWHSLSRAYSTSPHRNSSTQP